MHQTKQWFSSLPGVVYLHVCGPPRSLYHCVSWSVFLCNMYNVTSLSLWIEGNKVTGGDPEVLACSLHGLILVTLPSSSHSSCPSSSLPSFSFSSFVILFLVPVIIRHSQTKEEGRETFVHQNMYFIESSYWFFFTVLRGADAVGCIRFVRKILSSSSRSLLKVNNFGIENIRLKYTVTFLCQSREYLAAVCIYSVEDLDQESDSTFVSTSQAAAASTSRIQRASS